MLSATRATEPPSASTSSPTNTVQEAHVDVVNSYLVTPETASRYIDEPEAVRLEIFAYFLGSDASRTAALRSASIIPPPLYPLCLVLRYLIVKEHLRLQESSKRFNWSRKQVFAAVAAGYAGYSIHEYLKANPDAVQLPDHLPYPMTTSLEPATDDIHRQSSLQLTLQAAWHLAQAMLLCPQPLSAPPSALVLGSLYHILVQTIHTDIEHKIAAAASDTEKAMLDWILDGSDQWLAIDIDALRKAKKERKKKSSSQQQRLVHQNANRGSFSLLQLDTQDGGEYDEDGEEE